MCNLECDESPKAAFRKLKEKLTTAPVLGCLNLRDCCINHTDASDVRVGGVLSKVQEGK